MSVSKTAAHGECEHERASVSPVHKTDLLSGVTVTAIDSMPRFGNYTSSLGNGDSSVVRAPDSWPKGRGFQSLQERRENFLLQGRLSVLTLIQYPFYPRVTE